MFRKNFQAMAPGTREAQGARSRTKSPPDQPYSCGTVIVHRREGRSVLANDFLPSAWDYFNPSFWDISTLLGSFGLFFTLFCLFVRYLPMVALAEVKTVLPEANPHYHPESTDATVPTGAPEGAS